MELFDDVPEHRLLLSQLECLPKTPRGKIVGVTDYFLSLVNGEPCDSVNTTSDPATAQQETILVDKFPHKEADKVSRELDFSGASF